MLIAALVMAVIGLIALVTAVVTSSEVIAWVCIGASVIGVILLIIDALRERKNDAASSHDSTADDSTADDSEAADSESHEAADPDGGSTYDADYPDEQPALEESTEAATEADPAEAEPAGDTETTR
jgi:hypothetical protein